MTSSPFSIRKFVPEDADACFRIRVEAFIKLFHDEIGPDGVAAGINAHMPQEFIRLNEALPIFVAADDHGPAGYIALRPLEESVVEILFLYVRLDRIGGGIGAALARTAEDWIRRRRPEVGRMVLDTAVPKYNRRFYEKIGYREVGESECLYPDGPVRALRLAKDLR